MSFVPEMRNKESGYYIDINKLRHGLGDGVCHSLIGMHAYAGCDTISAFAGRGKLGANEIIALSGNVSRAVAVLGTIRAPIQEAASIHLQTVHIIRDNTGHQHIPPPAFLRTAWGASMYPASTIRGRPLHANHAR